MRYKRAKFLLMFCCLFISIGAIFGSSCMLIDPSGKLIGMNDLIHYFKVLPFSKVLFQNYVFSGIALFLINGVSNISAFYLIKRNKKIGIMLGTIFGFVLILWIIIQFIIFPLNILSISYFIFGLIQLVVGYMTYVFYCQENFKFDINDYNNIGINKDIIVVYFSRIGYTKKVAYEEADKIGTEILELKAKEKIENTSGFLWCGRYGMHKWRMKIKNIEIDLSKYKKIIIVSPIWVFSICAPIREFCYVYSESINEVEYIFTHFMNSNFLNVADEVDKIVGKSRKKCTSICIRLGKIKNKKEFKK